MVENKEVEINGVTYEVAPFLGEDCFKHYISLIEILGEPLARALIAAVSENKKAKKSPVDHLKNPWLDREMEDYIPALAEAIMTLTNKLSPNDALILFKALLKNTMVKTANDEGNKEILIPLNFNLHFGGGRMKPLFLLFVFVLEVNFADFLPSGTSLIEAVKSVTAAAAKA